VTNLERLLGELASGVEDRAEAAISSIIEIGESAIPGLLDLTRSADPDVRWWALRGLASLPDARAEWLVPFLDDPAPDVRQCAALGLAGKPDESAVEPLIHALADDDSMTASLAANALAKAGSLAVPALIDAVNQRPETESGADGRGAASQRIHALRALAEIRDHRAIPVMMQVMQEESALLQHWAQEGLERLGLDMVYIKPL
jgi:HEAT repeat protein